MNQAVINPFAVDKRRVLVVTDSEENYDYVFRLAETWNIDPAQMAIWRSYSAVPMHGLNGCIMGFYFGKYASRHHVRLTRQRRR